VPPGNPMARKIVLTLCDAGHAGWEGERASDVNTDTQEVFMSAGYTTSVLAVISLIVSAAPLRAQDASAPHDVANIPANAGAFAPRDVDLQRNQSITFGVPAHAADAENGATALFENAWDFSKPDSIPGFGSLPSGYDSRPVMPQISGK